MAYPPPPKLLSCRQVSSFLHDSLTALQTTRGEQLTTLQTAMLVTADGKLLAYESPLPVRTLRTHCSVAASLWAIHAASSASAAVALDPAAPYTSSQPGQQSTSAPELPPSLPHAGAASSVSAVPVPMSEANGDDGPEPCPGGSLPVSIAAGFGGGAVFVVHRLHCGLLFACSTPSPRRSSSSRPGTAGTGASPSSVLTPPAATLAAGSSGTPIQSSLLPQSTLQQTIPSPPGTQTSIPHRPTSHAPSTTAASPAHDSVRDLSFAVSAVPKALDTAAPITTSREVEAGGKYEREGDEREQQDQREQDAGEDTTSIRTVGTACRGDGVNKKESIVVTFAMVRQQVDELAVHLDEQLSGLVVPTENIGINGFC